MSMHTRSGTPANWNGATRVETNASLVLIGARGTGKTVLSVIAQSYFNLKPIDVAEHLKEAELNQTASLHLSSETVDGAQTTLSALQKVLTTYTTGCAIVWPAALLEDGALRLLKHYSLTHPVIHVTRSPKAIQQYLRVADASKVQKLLELGNRVYRACANSEFHNLDEQDVTGSNAAVCTEAGVDVSLLPRSLRLKRLERAFLQFIGNTYWRCKLEPRHDGLLLSPTRSPFTYLLALSLDRINGEDFRVQALNCGADVCQLDINVPGGDTGANREAGLADEISRAVAILVRFFDGPLVYNVKLSPALPEAPRTYLDLLNQGLRLGVDYMTIDLTIPKDQMSQIVATAGHTQLIGTFHDGNPGLDGWSHEGRWAMYKKARDLGLVGVRLTQDVQTPHDNFAVIGFAAQAARLPLPRPFITAYNKGAAGRPSQHLNQVLTPVITATLRSSNVSPPDAPLTISDSQNALFALSIWEPMHFSIIGVDVTYSLSPSVHTAAYQFFGMPHSFGRQSISNLSEMQVLLEQPQVGGISIAQGYKLTVFPFVQALSTHASNIGAINTLIPMRKAFQGVGPPPPEFWRDRCCPGSTVGFYGENTDWISMARCVLTNLSPANAITTKTTGLVIGAGGMARAAIYALMQLGVRNVVIHNRTVSNARSLAEHFSTIKPSREAPQLDPFSARVGSHSTALGSAEFDLRVLESRESDWYTDLAQPTIIISCVPASRVGEQPSADFTLPPGWMRSHTGGVVLDLNYRPILTPLLRQARRSARRGWVAVDGLENLAAQASAQFELFTGRQPPQGLMHAAALQNYGALRDDDEEASEVVKAKLSQSQWRL